MYFIFLEIFLISKDIFINKLIKTSIHQEKCNVCIFLNILFLHIRTKKSNRIQENKKRITFVLFTIILNVIISKISMGFITSASDFIIYVIIFKYIFDNIAFWLRMCR